MFLGGRGFVHVSDPWGGGVCEGVEKEGTGVK